MREPGWVRPLARVYLIVTSAVWVTASTLELSWWLVRKLQPCEVRGVKGTVLPICMQIVPVWVLALVGVLGILAAYLAARLTRPRAA